MKYIAAAAFAAVAVANPDGWETYTTPKVVDPSTTWSAGWVPPTATSTWASWSTPVKETSTWATWSTPVKETSTWATWSTPVKDTSSTWATWETTKKPEPTWSGWNGAPPAWTTTVVTAITTYCPEATKIVHAGKTWTVTGATTLTITDCPCTISVPIFTKTSTACGEKAASTWASWESASVSGKAAETWKNVDVSSKTAETWKNVEVSTKKTPEAGASTWATWAPYPAPSSVTPLAGTGWQGANVKVSATGSAWSPVATWKGAAPVNKANAGAAGLAGIIGAAALLL